MSNLPFTMARRYRAGPPSRRASAAPYAPRRAAALSSLLALSCAASLAAASLTARPAEAARMVPLPSGAVLVDGEITAGDDLRLVEALLAQKRAGKSTGRLFLNSPGGGVRAGVSLAGVIHDLRMHVVVGEGRRCASICVLLLAAGAERSVYSNAKLAVHSIGTYRNNAATPLPESADDRDWTLLLARYMAALGTPPAVIVKMITTKPDAIAGIDEGDAPGWVTVIPAGK